MQAGTVPFDPDTDWRRFDAGDLVVHPHHGVGRVISNRQRRLVGDERGYLEIGLVDNGLTIMVPCESATALGLRPVVGLPQVRQILAVLQAEPTPASGNWSAREKRYREQLKGRDVLELAAVVRDLGLRAREGRLASREQALYEHTRRQLACELSHALGLGAEEAISCVDEHIARAKGGDAPTPPALTG
jgi:CarD family transcriptional regulator, regulator of rRNA transcription